MAQFRISGNGLSAPRNVVTYSVSTLDFTDEDTPLPISDSIIRFSEKATTTVTLPLPTTVAVGTRYTFTKSGMGAYAMTILSDHISGVYLAAGGVSAVTAFDGNQGATCANTSTFNNASITLVNSGTKWVVTGLSPGFVVYID